MNKRKILTLALAVCMIAILAVGGSIAYLMDEDVQVNVFTIGNVKIDLFEDFNTEGEWLTPGVGTKDPQTGVVEFANTIEKEVYVENTGSEEAFVRVHIAIPAFTRWDAEKRETVNINVFNTAFDDMTTVDGQWIWGTTLDSNYPPRDGGTWNIVRDIKINNVPYKVYIVTYETKLNPAKDGNPADITPDAIDSVYMDSGVTNEEIDKWNAAYTDEFGTPIWSRIYVFAEGVQADGFTDAITALNEAFGNPQEEGAAYYNDVEWTAAGKGKTFEERTSNDGN